MEKEQAKSKSFHVAANGEGHAGTFPRKPGPRGDTKNNRNGLIWDVRANQKYTRVISQTML